MLTLCIDTSYKYLAIALINDEGMIAEYNEECFKGQSESLLVKVKEIFDQAKIDPLKIDAICIAKGPGSYTGVRIAMTLAKVIAAVAKLDLYTISTLRLYAGNGPKTMVLMDARANRAYVGIYDQDRVILADCVKELEQLDPMGYNLVGDAYLLGRADVKVDIAECFYKTRAYWEKVDDIDHLTPNYLKDSNAYLK